MNNLYHGLLFLHGHITHPELLSSTASEPRRVATLTTGLINPRTASATPHQAAPDPEGARLNC
jgi:hypothetical protein